MMYYHVLEIAEEKICITQQSMFVCDYQCVVHLTKLSVILLLHRVCKSMCTWMLCNVLWLPNESLLFDLLILRFEIQFQ